MHGRILPTAFLGYYPVQIRAYKALLTALHLHYGIPMECLMDDGELSSRAYPSSVTKKFKGVINHYNVSKKKWDCAGLELDKILEEIKKELCHGSV